jgi:hypothetical protein
MKGAIDFWAGFAKLMGGALALGVFLVGPPALAWWLIGPVAGIVLCAVLFVGYVSWAAWDREDTQR